VLIQHQVVPSVYLGIMWQIRNVFSALRIVILAHQIPSAQSARRDMSL
jgi:hypothetical protein